MQGLYRKKRIVAVFVMIASLLGLACYVYWRPTPRSIAPMPLPIVHQIPVKTHPWAQSWLAYGVTYSRRLIALQTQTSGIIDKISLPPGSHAASGQMLFSIKPSNVNEQPALLKARLVASKWQYEREKELSEDAPGGIKKLTLEKDKSQYQQDLLAWQQSLRITQVIAPVAGKIADSGFNLGDYVPAGTRITSLIPDNTPLLIRYSLPASYRQAVKLGQTVHFIPTGESKRYDAKISYISPLLDSKDYSLTLFAQLADNSALPINLFGKVQSIENNQTQVLAVRQSLVQTDAQGFYVLTVTNQRIRKQYFVPGEINAAGLIQVKSGLKKGLLIISSAVNTLMPGQRVKVAS